MAGGALVHGGRRRIRVTSGSHNSEASPDSVWRTAAWRVGGGYFWYYAGIGAFVPFIALHFRELGYSGAEVGLLTALPSIGVAIGGPIVGAAADALGVHRWVLRLALLTGAGLALLAATTEPFPLMLLVMAPLAIVLSPVPSMMDSYAVTASERANRSYGALRVWGSVGYLAAVLIMGRVMGDRVSGRLFVGYAVCLGLALLTVFALPPLAERRAQPLLTGIQTAALNRPLMVLLLVSYLLSIGTAAMNIYLGVHLEGIGGSASLIGVAFAISAASELPVVAFGGWFLSRLGAVRLAAVAIVVYALRFVAYSVITVPEWVLGVQLFHGLSYGAFLMASVTLAHRLASKEQTATAQALLTAMSFGFGSITGSLVGGILLDVVGTDGLFRGAALLMVVTLAVLVVGNRAAGLSQEPMKPRS